MHQLTKDPSAVLRDGPATVHSPKREMSQFELNRYLDYCSEMVSLVSKVGFLYIQEFNDPQAVNAVNDLETLTNGPIGQDVAKDHALGERLQTVGRSRD